jgi:hypothetical protein
MGHRDMILKGEHHGLYHLLCLPHPFVTRLCAAHLPRLAAFSGPSSIRLISADPLHHLILDIFDWFKILLTPHLFPIALLLHFPQFFSSKVCLISRITQTTLCPPLTLFTHA